MIEVISVLVLIGVMAAVVVGKVQSTEEVEFSEIADLIKNQLRVVQLEAMRKGGTADSNFAYQGIQFTNTGYQWIKRQSDDTLVTGSIFPGESAANILYSNKGNITVTTRVDQIDVTDFIVYFDARGVPYLEAVTLDAVTGGLTLTLSASGQSVSLQLAEETGFIQ